MHLGGVMAALLQLPQQPALGAQEGAVGLRGALHLGAAGARAHVDSAHHCASIHPSEGKIDR